MEDSSVLSPITLLTIVIFLFILNLMMIIQDVSSSFHYPLHLFFSNAYILFASTRNKKQNMLELPIIKKAFVPNRVDYKKTSVEEVKAMIDDSEALYERLIEEGEDYLLEKNEMMGKEIVKEAFRLFDENQDGFIDENELKHVLCLLGYDECTKMECRKMIKVFDENRDGKIDSGDCDALGVELLECLLRLAPNEEEERKLNRFSDDSVIIKLGPAERFLKELLHVPFVFKRVEAMLAVANFHSAIKRLRRSFSTVQAACDELSNSRMFSVLVEAILKTASKMNLDADPFKLDTLLKLVEVKGLDGRSSLLQFVVQELVKSEGSILEGIRNLNSELSNVKKSAEIEYDVLRSDVLKLCQRIKKIEELLQLSEECGSSGDQWLKFREKMAGFLKTAAEEIVKIKIRECSTLSALEEVTEQFHGDASNEGHTLRVFMIARDFLFVLDKVCNGMGM